MTWIENSAILFRWLRRIYFPVSRGQTKLLQHFGHLSPRMWSEVNTLFTLGFFGSSIWANISEHLTGQQPRPDHSTGNFMPYSFAISVWVLLRPLQTILTLKMQETGPTVYSPYPRRSTGINHASQLILVGNKEKKALNFNCRMALFQCL